MEVVLFFSPLVSVMDQNYRIGTFSVTSPSFLELSDYVGEGVGGRHRPTPLTKSHDSLPLVSSILRNLRPGTTISSFLLIWSESTVGGCLAL